MNVVEELEEEFAKFTNVEHAIACCNGTAALHVALLSLEVKKGDKVITTPFSFISSSNCILYCGATPVFADINPETYLIDPIEVAAKWEPKTVGVLPVHLFGKVCDMPAIKDFADRFDCWIVEDCSQALGAVKELTGEIGTYSFYVTKNLHTGEGGMIVTNNVELAEKARMIIDHGQDRKYHHVVLGYNYRMPWYCALVGLNQLKYHKIGILAELGIYGIKQGHYPLIIPHQPLYRKLGLDKGRWPNAEKAAEEARKWRK